MVAIIMHRRRSLIMPKTVVKGEKVLKLCIRCRHNKTKCDAVRTSPHPCTYCSKKNIPCRLDVMKPPQREHDATERIVYEVQQLHRKLDSVISSKTRLVQKLIRSQQAQEGPAQHPVAQIQQAFFAPAERNSERIYIDPIPTLSLSDAFTICSSQKTAPVSLSTTKAARLFAVFAEQFGPFLPVLPPSFFERNLHEIHAESAMLFWSIAVTALLAEGSAQEYADLAAHVQNLVVVDCWFNTPRSLLSVVALLILTTWPLPEDRALQIQDCILVKYISLMKNLALQFGLHKLPFIGEFSKKTNMQLDGQKDVNDTLRERIYKYVNINANYWLVHLGLLTSNYNGFHQDYIVNRAANFDIFLQERFLLQDNFINSLLKVSLVQLKMNETMSEVGRGLQVGRLIHLHMFERILDAYLGPASPLMQDALLLLLLEISKLQLYIYYLSKSDLTVAEYRAVVYRTLASCKSLLDLFESRFKGCANYFLVPMHYRFSVELVALTLLQVHACPLLTAVSHYAEVKAQFLRAYGIVTNHGNPEWASMNQKLVKILRKFDACDKAQILALKSKGKSFFVVDKMADYLVSSLHYELLWQVFQAEKMQECGDEIDINWGLFGLDAGVEQHKQIMDYVVSAGPILPASL